MMPETMTCREVSEFLMAYLDDELPVRKRRVFEEHLHECEDCVAYLESYKATIELGKAAFDCDDDGVPASVPDELVQAILRSRAHKK
jgi:anti-sigma factor RsiW